MSGDELGHRNDDLADRCHNDRSDDGGPRRRRLVVGITGATGSILGIRLLEALRALDVETHLVLSDWAERTIRIETDYTVAEVRELADSFYHHDNQAAPVSSGSFPADGMVIIPCSMNTLAALAYGIADKLIVRAADVMLKEQRKLVIVPRETPLNTIHIRNLLTLSEMGVSIVPPMPAFYNHPETVDDFIRHIVARVLDQFGIDNELTVRWGVTRRLHAKPARPRAPARLDDLANVGRPAAATASAPDNMGNSRAEGDLPGHRIISLDRHAAEADASWMPE